MLSGAAGHGSGAVEQDAIVISDDEAGDGGAHALPCAQGLPRGAQADDSDDECVVTGVTMATGTKRRAADSSELGHVKRSASAKRHRGAAAMRAGPAASAGVLVL